MANRGTLKRKRKSIEKVERPVRVRRYKMYFLIVCEDEKTEPTYFDSFRNQFPNKTLYLKCVGTGRDQLGVVEQAIESKSILEQESGKPIDFVWVVFDKDNADENEAKKSRFNQALQLASENNIKVAFSNEVFELWLLLHLEEVSSEKAMPRAEIYDRLEKAIQKMEQQEYGDAEFEPFVYEHGKAEILQKVEQYGHENIAIERAKKLRKHFVKANLIESNPSTTVDQLVVELRDWISYYNY